MRIDHLHQVLTSGNSNVQPLTDGPGGDAANAQRGTNIFDQPRSLSVAIARPSEASGETSELSGWSSKNHASLSRRKDGTGLYLRHYSGGYDENSSPPDFDRDDHGSTAPKAEKQHYARTEQRSITVKNLSERTTHQDILNVIRGGAILDIYVRSAERCAIVSFIEGSAAQSFMNHVKRNDVYLQGKRVRGRGCNHKFIGFPSGVH